MADTYSDEQIAATLNRTGLRTGVGNTWSEQRVYALRRSQHLQGTRSRSRDVLTLEQAAEILGVSATCVRHMIERKIIPATQVVDCAPWEIPAAAVNDDEVRRTVLKTKARGPRQRVSTDDQQALFNRS